MAIDLNSLRITGNRDNLFSRGFWNTFLRKLGLLLDSQVKPYSVYTALLTQSGTDAPVATVLENTLSGLPVWSYSDVGKYTISLANGFTENKTLVFIQAVNFSADSNTNDSVYDISDSDTSNIVIGSTQGGLASDSILLKTPIEIRVYP